MRTWQRVLSGTGNNILLDDMKFLSNDWNLVYNRRSFQVKVKLGDNIFVSAWNVLESKGNTLFYLSFYLNPSFLNYKQKSRSRVKKIYWSISFIQRDDRHEVRE